MEKYEDSTQRLHSKFPTQEYRDNYDKIFGKKKYWYEKKLEEQEDAKEEVVVHSD